MELTDNNFAIYAAKYYEDFEFKTDRLLYEEGKYEPFVYIVRVKDQDKYYIGMRVAKGCLLSDLGTKYFTSSKIVSKIWKDDPENIEIVLQKACNSNHDALILEGSLILDEYNAVKDDQFLNYGYNGVYFNTSGRYPSEETREKTRKALIEYWSDEENREKRSGVNNGFYGQSHTEETREKMRKSRLEFWDEEQRKKQSEALTKRFRSPEVQQKHSESQKKRWETEEAREKHSEAVKEGWGPEERKKQSEKLKKYYAEDSEARRKNSERVKKYYAENPEVRRLNSERIKNLPKKQCPHCKIVVSPAMYGRWHGEKCRRKS